MPLDRAATRGEIHEGVFSDGIRGGLCAGTNLRSEKYRIDDIFHFCVISLQLIDADSYLKSDLGDRGRFCVSSSPVFSWMRILI